jgi:hypothetical protein
VLGFVLSQNGRSSHSPSSRVHCDSLDEGGAQLYPCGIATATPQHFTVASRQTSTCRPGSSPFRNEGNGCAPLPTLIRQVGAGKPLRDVVTLVPRVLLSVTLAGPAPSGSTDTSRLCRGGSRPPRRFPDQAAPSSPALLRQGQRWKVSHLHSNHQRLTAHVDGGLARLSRPTDHHPNSQWR